MEVINGLPLFKSNDKEATPELFPSTLQPLCFNDLPETIGKIHRTLENIVTWSSLGVRYKSCSEQFLKSYRKIHAVEYFFLIIQTLGWSLVLVLRHRCFCVSFAIFLRTPFLKGTCEWLLLKTGLFYNSCWKYWWGWHISCHWALSLYPLEE